jgi:hypothetical protein
MLGETDTPTAAADAGPSIGRWVFVAVPVLCLVPLFVTPVIPAIDLYNHIARYFIISGRGASAAFAQNYQVSWGLLPNVGLDVLASALMRLFPPLLVAKLIAALIIFTQYAGVIVLNKTIWGKSSAFVAVLSGIFLYSYILNWGFTNFLLGLGLSLLASAWWLTMRKRLFVATPVSIVVALLIFFVHGFAFAVYGATTACLEVGQLFSEGERRVRRYLVALGCLASQAILPALLFLHTPTVGAKGGLSGTMASFAHYAMDSEARRRRLIVEAHHRLETVVRVAEGPSFAFDAVMFIALVSILALWLMRGQLKIAKLAWPVLGLMVVACVIVPDSLFNVGYLSDRLPLVLALLACASLAPAAPANKQGLMVAIVGVLLALRIGAVAVDWAQYREDYDQFQAVSSHVEPGALARSLIVSGADIRDGFKPRCQMYSPLLVIERGAIAPLFADPTQQPLALKGPLNASRRSDLVAPDFRINDVGTYYEDTLNNIAAQRSYKYVLVCGIDRLKGPLPANVSSIASAGALDLLRVQ